MSDLGTNKYDWRDYFTWLPKAFGPHIVWLKTIQRQWNPRKGCYFYRIKPTEENNLEW